MKARTFCLALVCLLISAVAFGQEPPRTLGKTDAQILAMGQEKWSEYFEKKGGGSNADMIEACMAYTEAATRRNARLISRLPNAKAAQMRSLDKLMMDFGGHMMNAGSFISDGGSMWALFDAGSASDAQDALFAVLGGAMHASPAMVVSKVTKQIAKVKAAIQKSRDMAESAGRTEAEALKDFELGRLDFVAIQKIAASLDRKKSNALLDFCFKRAATAVDQG